MPTENTSHVRVQSELKPVFMPWQQDQVNLRPAPKNRVNFEHHHTRKNEVNRSWHTNQFNFGPTRSITIPRTKNESLSIPTQNTSQIRSFTQENKVISTPLLKWCQFDTHPKWKSISMPPHKDKLSSVHTLKSSIFSPRHENEGNYDPYTKFKSCSSPI